MRVVIPNGQDSLIVLGKAVAEKAHALPASEKAGWETQIATIASSVASAETLAKLTKDLDKQKEMAQADKSKALATLDGTLRSLATGLSGKYGKTEKQTLQKWGFEVDVTAEKAPKSNQAGA